MVGDPRATGYAKSAIGSPPELHRGARDRHSSL